MPSVGYTHVKIKQVADIQTLSIFFILQKEPKLNQSQNVSGYRPQQRNREMSNITTSQKLPSANVFIGFIVFQSLFLILGIFGNACVIIYNVFLNHSKTPTSYFVVNLAINDYFACCIIYPIWMATFMRSALRITSDQTLFCLVD